MTIVFKSYYNITNITRAERNISSHYEPVTWPWWKLANSQRRLYCASLNSHCSVGLVSRPWEDVDWACVLRDCRIHNDRASRLASSRQCAWLFYNSCADFFVKASHHPGLSVILQPRFCSLRLMAFPKTIIAVEREEICECDRHKVHKLSQRRLTADWLAPRESDCSRMHRNSPLTGCQVTSRPHDRFSRYSKWTDTFRTGLV